LLACLAVSVRRLRQSILLFGPPGREKKCEKHACFSGVLWGNYWMLNRIALIVIVLIFAPATLVRADDKVRQANSFPPPPSSTQFSQGMVTLSFDDAWASQYTNALPILRSSGLPATFYLISTAIQNNAKLPDRMTPAMATTIANDGHEIGGHTITH